MWPYLLIYPYIKYNNKIYHINLLDKMKGKPKETEGVPNSVTQAYKHNKLNFDFCRLNLTIFDHTWWFTHTWNIIKNILYKLIRQNEGKTKETEGVPHEFHNISQGLLSVAYSRHVPCRVTSPFTCLCQHTLIMPAQ